MKLADEQKDSLTEAINIAFSRTAAALSDLTSQRVVLETPTIGIHPIDELPVALTNLVNNELATVHQIFNGPVSGDALLVLNYDGAVLLAGLLTDTQTVILDMSAREVLIEVGNILLNTCLSMLGDLLQVRISFSVPLLHLKHLDTLLDTLIINSEDVSYALIARTAFNMHDSAISGYLIFVLGVKSLDYLLGELGRLE